LIHFCILLAISVWIILWCTDPRTSSSRIYFCDAKFQQAFSFWAYEVYEYLYIGAVLLTTWNGRIIYSNYSTELLKVQCSIERKASSSRTHQTKFHNLLNKGLRFSILTFSWPKWNCFIRWFTYIPYFVLTAALYKTGITSKGTTVLATCLS